MKKEMFKVCALGLVALTLVTGCGRENESTKKLAKSNEQEIKIDKESNINKESNSNEESNINIESNTTSNKVDEKKETAKVVKVEIDQKKVGSNRIKFFANATDSKGKTIWTKDLFTFTDQGGTDFNDMIGEQCDKYFYLGNGSKFEALDIQTGKKAWTASGEKELGGAVNFREYNGKLYAESGMAGYYDIAVYDMSNGKYLKTIELLKALEKQDTGFDFETYYDLIVSTMKIKDNKITFEVHDSDDYGHDTGYVGLLVVDLSNDSVKLQK